MSASSFPLVPVKFIGEIRSGGTPKSDDRNWGGDIPFVTPPDLNGLDGGLVEEWERSVTPQGAADSTVVSDAVVLSCRAPIGHVGRVAGDVAFNQGCKAIQPGDEGSARFLAYSLVGHRKELQATGRGTTFTELSTIDFSSICLPWPSRTERVRITDYLDRETGEIDAMIGKLDELAVVLEFRRAQVIEAVFARYPWHRLRWVVALSQTGPFGTQLSAREYISGGVPLINPTHISRNGITPEEHVSVASEKAAELSRHLLRPGDIVLGRKGDVDKAAIVSGDLGPALCGSDSMLIRADAEQCEARLLWWFFQSPGCHSQLESMAVGTAVPGLNQTAISQLRIRLPRPEQQADVGAEIDEATRQIDAMLAKVTELKELLIERRAALITDVVTGRKVVA